MFSSLLAAIRKHSFLSISLIIFTLALVVIYIHETFSLNYFFLPIYGAIAGYLLKFGSKDTWKLGLVSFISYFLVMFVYYDQMSLVFNLFGSLLSAIGIVLMGWVLVGVHHFVKNERMQCSLLTGRC